MGDGGMGAGWATRIRYPGAGLGVWTRTRTATGVRAWTGEQDGSRDSCRGATAAREETMIPPSNDVFDPELCT